MSILTRLASFFAPQRIADRKSLKGFMESRAAYLVQKSIMEYSQARANMLFSTLLSEKLFLDAYERSRWHSYPAALSMVTETVEGYLRETEGIESSALDIHLVEIGREILAPFPVPAGEGVAFWDAALDHLRRDLAQAALGAPKPVRNIPFHRASEIFEVLPVSDQIKRHDFDMFQNTLRFHLTEIRVEFEEKADAAAVVRSLTA